MVITSVFLKDEPTSKGNVLARTFFGQSLANSVGALSATNRCIRIMSLKNSSSSSTSCLHCWQRSNQLSTNELFYSGPRLY